MSHHCIKDVAVCLKLCGLIKAYIILQTNIIGKVTVKVYNFPIPFCL